MLQLLLQHLITFAKVVETGSFTRAAHALNLSQPSATKHVGSLEGHLGTELLRRDGKRLVLTPAGEEVYEYARKIEQLVRECQSAVEAARDPGVGTVNIGCVHTIGLYVLPDLLAEFARDFPRIRLTVKTARVRDTVQLLLQHEIDVGLITAPISHERVVCSPLYEDPVVIVSAPAPRFSLPDPMEPSDLLRLPVIGFQRNTRFRGFLDLMLGRQDIVLEPVMEFDNHETIKAMAALGLGLALLPASAVAADLRAGRLIECSVPDLGSLSRTTCLIYLKDRKFSPAVQKMLQFLTDRFNEGETAAGPAEE